MRYYRHCYCCNSREFNEDGDEIDRLLGMAVMDVERQLLPGKSMQEPDYTAAITTEFPNLMRRYFRLGNWKIGASFAHQRPYVTFTSFIGSTVTCELGDLLLVCHTKVDGQDRYNASLMQLKRDDGTFTVHEITSPKELVQLELYVNWPKFHFKYNPTMDYDIMPKAPTSGAQYLFINDCEPTFTHAIPSISMENNDEFSLGMFLVAFTQWQVGRPISPEKDPQQDDWSKAIWTLIDGNRRSFYNRRNIQYKQVPRNNGDFLQLMTSQEFTIVNNSYFEEYLKGDIPNHDNDNEVEGMPTIPMLFIEL